MKLLFKNLLFTLVMPGTAAVYVPLWLAGDRSVAPAPGGWLDTLGIVGVLAIAAGAGVYGWCVWDFATFGRGTPAPIDAPRKLVVRGLYRYTRNPMYLGVLTVVCGWALLFHSMILMFYGLALATCFQLFIVLYEEPHLEQQFGEEYRRYRGRVGRWLRR